MKKSKNIVLIVTPVLSAALLNACGGSSQPRTFVDTTTAPPASTPNPIAPPVQAAQTRDVYNNLNDCVKDWLDKELCEQMSEDDDKDYRTRYKTGGKGRYFYGPKYSSTDRLIVYKGKTITPTGKVATKMPTFTSSAPSSKTTTGTTASTTKTSTLPSSTSTSKSTTSTTAPSSSSSSSTTPYSSSSSSTSPYSSSSSTTRSGFGSTSSSSSSSSRSSSTSSSSGS